MTLCMDIKTAQCCKKKLRGSAAAASCQIQGAVVCDVIEMTSAIVLQ